MAGLLTISYTAYVCIHNPIVLKMLINILKIEKKSIILKSDLKVCFEVANSVPFLWRGGGRFGVE